MLVIYLEERFLKDSNGVYYSLSFHDDFWERYLNCFDSLLVVARVKNLSIDDEVPQGYRPTNSLSVRFHELPYYHGVQWALLRFPRLVLSIFSVSTKNKFHLLRLPGFIGILALFFLISWRKNFGVELVGDPYDVFDREKGVGGKLAGVYRLIFTQLTKLAVKRADAVAYVTKEKMQHRYVASKNAFTTHYSSIILNKSLILDEKPIKSATSDNFFNILMVGSLEQRYKGFDLAFNAYNEIKDGFQYVRFYIVGDGIYKRELLDLAVDLKIQNNVHFLGKISREQVLGYMDEADLFIIPSRTEGLPRALIEAMARGVPAIGSNVGGIPELLSDDFLFEKENFNELARLLSNVIPSYALRLKMSQLNLKVAKNYSSDLLEIRRNKFYSYLASEK